MRFLILLPALLLVTAAAGFSAARAAADPVAGLWLTQNGDAVVRFYACGAAFCGRFYWVAPGEDGEVAEDVNNHDPGKRRRSLCGLPFISDFQKTGEGEYSDGQIYNPQDGEIYSADMKIQDDGTLNLHGYVLLPVFGQSQTWTRVETHAACKGAKP